MKWASIVLILLVGCTKDATGPAAESDDPLHDLGCVERISASRLLYSNGYEVVDLHSKYEFDAGEMVFTIIAISTVTNIAVGDTVYLSYFAYEPAVLDNPHQWLYRIQRQDGGFNFQAATNKRIPLYRGQPWDMWWTEDLTRPGTYWRQWNLADEATPYALCH